MSVLGLAMASPGNNAPTFNQQKRNTFIADLQYSEQTAYNQKAMELNKELCREGMVLLKNRNNALPFGGDISKVSIFGKASVDLQYGGGGSGSGSVARLISKNPLKMRAMRLTLSLLRSTKTIPSLRFSAPTVTLTGKVFLKRP